MSLQLLKYLASDLGRAIAPAPCRPAPLQWSDSAVTAAWLGHATVLVNFFGLTILTDPVFFGRVGLRLGPLTLGPKRYVACALRPEELPRIDLILLSHAHMDHLDLRSLGRLNRDALVVTAAQTADVLGRMRFPKIVEMDWNESATFQPGGADGGITISAFKLRHWGARMRTDSHRRYNAYVLERGGRRICFAGDTAHTDARALGSRGAIDLFIAPIGAYHPWTQSHCTPEEALTMADEANARFLLPIHHQTFKLSWEPLEEPIARFRNALALAPERIALTRIGETFVLPGTGQQTAACS